MNTFQCLRFICGWIPHHRWHRGFDGRPVWYFSQHMLATATFPAQDKGTTKVLQQSSKDEWNRRSYDFTETQFCSMYFNELCVFPIKCYFRRKIPVIVLKTCEVGCFHHRPSLSSLQNSRILVELVLF